MGGMLGGKAGLTYCHMGTAASCLDPVRDALAAAPGLPRRALAAHPGLHPYLHPRLSTGHRCVLRADMWPLHSAIIAAGLCSLECAAPRLLVESDGKRRSRSLLLSQDIHWLMP